MNQFSNSPIVFYFLFTVFVASRILCAAFVIGFTWLSSKESSMHIILPSIHYTRFLFKDCKLLSVAFLVCKSGAIRSVCEMSALNI